MKKSLIIVFIIILCFSFIKNNNESMVIPSDSIRLRIISNSNNEIDIRFKKELKSYVEGILYDLVKNSSSKDEAENIIVNNLDFINNKIKLFLGNNDYKLDYGQNYFPRKIYKGVVYEEGLYDSLVITLGNGRGNNWWCVLFPPLCLMEDNDNTSDVEYQLFISRIIKKFNNILK